MPGTVMIDARPRFAGGERLGVWVDGAVVGKVFQGGCFEVTLEDGDHVLSLSASGFRSRRVAVRVSEGARLYLDGGRRGWWSALSSIAGAAIGAAWFDHHRLLALFFALAAAGTMVVPGSLVWLRVAPTAPVMELPVVDRPMAER